MKTLDEVIKAYEICMSDESKNTNCMGCPYADEKGEPLCLGEDKEDALHHLKEYKRYQNTPSRHRHMALVDYFDELQKNEPLTWDELKQMEGKPVWVEYNLHLCEEEHRRMWIIVQKIMSWRRTDELIYFSGFVFSKEELGKSWQAYRKERDENA